MNKKLQDKIEDFLRNATAESILQDCKEWDIRVDYTYSDTFIEDPVQNKFESKHSRTSYNKDDKKNNNYNLAA